MMRMKWNIKIILLCIVETKSYTTTLCALVDVPERALCDCMDVAWTSRNKKSLNFYICLTQCEKCMKKVEGLMPHLIVCVGDATCSMLNNF